MEYSEKFLSADIRATLWERLLLGRKVLTETLEAAAQARLLGVDSEEPVPVESEQEGVRLIDDPTNHDKMAMFYVYKCRLALPDITDRTESNRIRASKWICAELSAKEGLRVKHLDRIRVKFLRLIFLVHENDIEDAVDGASRGFVDRTRMPEYSHVSRGWFGWLLPRGRAPGYRRD